MAFSMAPTMAFSQGVMVIERASATVTVATWLSGISDP